MVNASHAVKTKTQFIKRDAIGGSFLNTSVNKSLLKCICQDTTLRVHEQNINRVDNAAYHHDLCYSKHDDTKTRNEVCDKTMLVELSGIVNQTLSERIDKSIVGKLIKAKDNFG